jgi:hypothetical protein
MISIADIPPREKTKPNRYGRFFVSDSVLLYDYDEIVLAFFRLRIFVTRCEHNYLLRRLEVTAMSPYFPEAGEAEEIPLVEITLTRGGEPAVSLAKWWEKPETPRQTYLVSEKGVVA